MLRGLSLLVCLLFLSSGNAFLPPRTVGSSGAAHRLLRIKAGATSSDSPFAIVVEAEIVPERVEEFLDVIEKDAVVKKQHFLFG